MTNATPLLTDLCSYETLFLSDPDSCHSRLYIMYTLVFVGCPQYPEPNLLPCMRIAIRYKLSYIYVDVNVMKCR